MKMVIGAYLIMVFDPEILFNEGFYDLLYIRVEDGDDPQATLPGAARRTATTRCRGGSRSWPGRSAAMCRRPPWLPGTARAPT